MKYTFYHAALKIGRSKAHGPKAEDIVRSPDIRSNVAGVRSIAFTKRHCTLIAGRKMTLQLMLVMDEPGQLLGLYSEALEDLCEIRNLAGRLDKELEKITKESS